MLPALFMLGLVKVAANFSANTAGFWYWVFHFLREVRNSRKSFGKLKFASVCRQLAASRRLSFQIERMTLPHLSSDAARNCGICPWTRALAAFHNRIMPQARNECRGRLHSYISMRSSAAKIKEARGE